MRLATIIVVIVVLLMSAALPAIAVACPRPPDPPIILDPPSHPPVPPEVPPNDPPQDPPPTNDPIVWPEPPDDPTSIAAPEPRTFSDGPSGAQKVIMVGSGVYEFYRRDNVRFDTHVPAVAVDHAAHERNEYRDVVLTPGQPTEYLLPVGLTYLFKWTPDEGHIYVRTFAIGAPGADIEINLP
jgi:hypothetical protein